MGYPLSRSRATAFLEVDEIASTNTALVELATARDLPAFSVMVSESQSGGRGRLGRVWSSVPGAGLAISVLLPAPRSDPGWLPLAAGLAMADAIEPLVPGVAVKWPNDVLIGSRKICGVLAEVVPNGRGVVVGAGVNTRMLATQLPVPTATSLVIEGVEVDDGVIDRLLVRYLGGLRAAAGAIDDVTRRRIVERCATIGQRVRVDTAAGELIGRGVGLDDDGRLRVLTDRGEVVVAAGDVTHLRPH